MTRIVRVMTARSHRARVRGLGLASVAAIVAVGATATPAVAHVGGPTHGFADGALHPIGGPDHLLAMVAVGIVAAILASPLLVPGVFLVAMTAGGALGLAGVSLPAVELLIVGSVIALGAAIVSALGEQPLAWLVPLLVVAGLAHGNAHGAEAPAAADPARYVLGFLVATAALHAAGVIGGTVARRWAPARVTVGAAVAAGGAVLLVG